MKIKYLFIMCILIVSLVGCYTNKEEAVKEAVDDLVSDIKSIEVGEGNMSMTKGGEVTTSYSPLLGVVTKAELSLPSPTGDVCIELINETYARIFNCENNNTIKYEDISDGNIYVESPTVTIEFVMACCKKLFGGYELIHKNSCPDSKIVEDSKCEE